MNLRLNTDWLKKNCQKIHYFGLGFIQIKLDEFNRVHFYTPKELPLTTNEEEIHNHRYSFVSYILDGIFHQKFYHVNLKEDGDFILTQESCQADDTREFEKKPCDIKLVYSQSYNATDRYYIDHNTFHTVESNETYPAITHVERWGYQKELADVVYRKYQPPTCPFSVKVSEDHLWEIVDSRINYT